MCLPKNQVQLLIVSCLFRDRLYHKDNVLDNKKETELQDFKVKAICETLTGSAKVTFPGSVYELGKKNSYSNKETWNMVA